MSNKKNVVVLAAKYPDADHAQRILTRRESMHHALTSDMDDAVMLTREPDGKIKTHETTDVTTRKGAKRGLIAGAILGVIYPPSLLVTALAGGGIGDVRGHVRAVDDQRFIGLDHDVPPGRFRVDGDALDRGEHGRGGFRGQEQIAVQDRRSGLGADGAAELERHQQEHA